MNEYYEIKFLKERTDYISRRYYESIKLTNDKLLLTSIQNYLDYTWKPSVTFREILKIFYQNYLGNKLEWLNHTIDIVYALKDSHVDEWLTEELNKIDKKYSVEEIIDQNKERIENCPGTLKDIMQEIAAETRFKWSYLNKVRKEKCIYKK